MKYKSRKPIVVGLAVFFIAVMFMQFNITKVSAHHESCDGLIESGAPPDRIVGCVEQSMRTQRAECERSTQDATLLQECYDEVARHHGRDPEGSNATPPPANSGNTSVGQSDIDRHLATGVNILTAVAGLAITGSIIVGGIQYMTAGGNGSQVSSAKNRIMVSVASLLMLGFGYAVLQWLIPGGIFK